MTSVIECKRAIDALAVAMAAARPVTSLTTLQRTALEDQTRAVVALIDGAASARGQRLDAADPTGYAGAMPAALLLLGIDARESRQLADMRAYVGRALFNLEQAEG